MGDWFSSQAAGGSLLLAVPVAVIAGLVSFFSPCVACQASCIGPLDASTFAPPLCEPGSAVPTFPCELPPCKGSPLDERVIRWMRSSDVCARGGAYGASAAASSPTLWKRWAGSFSRHRTMTSSIAAGTPGIAALARGVGSNITVEMRAGIVSATNGSCAVSSW